MDYIYAPWRDEYIKDKKDGECVFCHISKNPNLDSEHKVLFRDKLCFVVMNKYPYTPAHFMIIPHIHIDNIEKLDREIWLRVSDLTQKGVKLLKEFGADGVNIGMNLGVSAGAGIAEHVHMHLVPRWQRDTNFITTIGEARVYSTDFENIFNKLTDLSTKYFF